MERKVKEALFSIKDELDMFSEDSIMITLQRKDVEVVVKDLHFKNDDWSNQSAIGYAILAAEQAGLESYEIQLLVNSMRRQFDEKTLEVAADIYRNSDY